MSVLKEIREKFKYEEKQCYRVDSNKAVAYCRVSTSGQYMEDASPATQIQDIAEQAKRDGKVIVKHMDYVESSGRHSDRKSFEDLMEYLSDPANDISTVYVYHSFRWGRDMLACGEMLENLISMGIEFIDISDPQDIFTNEGRIRQLDKFLDSEKDNLNRLKYNMDGIIRKAKRGDYIPPTPIGYKKFSYKQGRSKVQQIVFDDNANLIRKAFRKRLDEHMSLTQIRKWLNEKGVQISVQTVSHMFANPFYCGVFSDGWTLRAHGKPILGKHEPMISQEEYCLLNGMLNPKRMTSKVTDRPELPLRRHLVCSCCGMNMTGEMKKSKGLAYYRCNKCDCGNNMNAKKLHPLYMELLGNYTIKEEFSDFIRHNIYQYLIASNNKIAELNEGIRERISEKNEFKEKTIIAMIQADLSIRKDMESLIAKTKDEISELESEIIQNNALIMEPMDVVNHILSFGLSIKRMWFEGDLQTRRLVQDVAFPMGVRYSKKSNTLDPVIVSPILRLMRFLNDLDGGNNFKNVPTNPNLDLGRNDENRTFPNNDNLGQNPIESSDYNKIVGGFNNSENDEMNRAVNYLSKSNIDKKELIDSIESIKDIRRWIYLTRID